MSSSMVTTVMAIVGTFIGLLLVLGAIWLTILAVVWPMNLCVKRLDRHLDREGFQPETPLSIATIRTWRGEHEGRESYMRFSLRTTSQRRLGNVKHGDWGADLRGRGPSHVVFYLRTGTTAEWWIGTGVNHNDAGIDHIIKDFTGSFTWWTIEVQNGWVTLRLAPFFQVVRPEGSIRRVMSGLAQFAQHLESNGPTTEASTSPPVVCSVSIFKLFGWVAVLLSVLAVGGAVVLVGLGVV
ncbi:MAG TPA: hypothetical protein EYO58_06265 [Flavobacteriales bacterium]|nr:hypothetical protein [Flavobacteriales bacterium]